MASVTLGRIEEFDSSREEWPQYAERLEHFFAANSIVEDEKTFSFSDRDRCCYVQGAERPGCVCYRS